MARNLGIDNKIKKKMNKKKMIAIRVDECG